jgi:PAS domain S-box-containing protein
VRAPDERQREIESLRARLAEAEETLRAIREGEVDALVVKGPNGPRVYTLKGADEPYRVLVEQMPEGAVTLSEDGLVLYSNRSFAEMIGVPLEQVIGASVARYVIERDRAALTAAVRAARRASLRREFTLRRASGVALPALLALGPLPAGGGEAAVSLIVTDLTEQRRTEEIAAAERFLRSILEQAAEPIVVCDAGGRITHASRAALALGAGEIVGQPFVDALLLEVPDGSDPARRGRRVLGSRLAQALRGNGVAGTELCWTGPQGERHHYLLSAAPLHDRHDRVVGCIVMLVEISDRKRAEERQQVLLAELSHRVKNTLATVRSIARQTMRNASSLESFASMFDGRLGALAVAHGLLTQTGWGEVELGELIRRIVAPYDNGEPANIEIGGSPARLPARQVVPMTLMLHELATNAAKYGALSTPTGRLAVAWTVEVAGHGRTVRLRWREVGGPEVRPPRGKGFGTALIERSMAYELDGEVRLDYRPEGLCCELIFPLSFAAEDLLREAEDSAERLRADLESRTAL